jgi:hypothetical protein
MKNYCPMQFITPPKRTNNDYRIVEGFHNNCMELQSILMSNAQTRWNYKTMWPTDSFIWPTTQLGTQIHVTLQRMSRQSGTQSFQKSPTFQTDMWCSYPIPGRTRMISILMIGSFGGIIRNQLSGDQEKGDCHTRTDGTSDSKQRDAQLTRPRREPSENALMLRRLEDWSILLINYCIVTFVQMSILTPFLAMSNLSDKTPTHKVM